LWEFQVVVAAAESEIDLGKEFSDGPIGCDIAAITDIFLKQMQ
jgi:hypothetical protein